MSFGLAYSVNAARRRISPVSQHRLSCPEVMPAQLLSPGIVRQFYGPKLSRRRINLNVSSPLYRLFSRAIDHGRVHYADWPSTDCPRHLACEHLSQHLRQPALGHAQTIK